MSSVPESAPADAAPATAAPPAAAPAAGAGRLLLAVTATAAAAGLVSSVLLWQKLGHIQEQLARQSQDAGTQAIEARTLARQAQEQVTEATARLAVQEARVNEVALQRGQLEELMQSLSRSRDENLVVDIESGLRLAQQQAQLTGSLEPLVAALKSAQQRIERAAQPRLAPVQRAIAHDLERVGGASVTDTAGLLARLDDLVRQTDELPLLNAVAQASAVRRLSGQAPVGSTSAVQDSVWLAWLQRSLDVVLDEVRGLVRVSRIERPEAVLLAPEQAFFLRENLKLRLLNARLALLSRQFDIAQSDLRDAQSALERYFDRSSRGVGSALEAVRQVAAQARSVTVPRPEATLAAIAAASAGR